MSEELLNALRDFNWTTVSPGKYAIHYDPKRNGSITQIGAKGQTKSLDPFIIVSEKVGLEFLTGQRYRRSYHVVNEKLEMKTIQYAIYEASDKRLNAITDIADIEVGTYFITVKGDPDLIIDTIEVTSENIIAETQRIKEYLENSDCYKDK
jgi:hypothetical protein